MVPPRLEPDRLAAVLAALATGDEVPRAELATAVRATLAEFAGRHRGRSVEVRVPPWGAVQVGVPGVAGGHRRGTPPNVVETDPVTWLQLVGGAVAWSDAVASGRVVASGVHADLAALLGPEGRFPAD